MYTKEELEKLPIPELMEIAGEMDVKVSQNDDLETVIYAILDKAAENSAAGVPTPKRKRTRIAKDNSKVYTVSGSEGENLDTKPKKGKAAKKPSLDDLFAEQEALRLPQQRAVPKRPQPSSRLPRPRSPLPRSVAASRRRNWRHWLPPKLPGSRPKPTGSRRKPLWTTVLPSTPPTPSPPPPRMFPRLPRWCLLRKSIPNSSASCRRR